MTLRRISRRGDRSAIAFFVASLCASLCAACLCAGCSSDNHQAAHGGRELIAEGACPDASSSVAQSRITCYLRVPERARISVRPADALRLTLHADERDPLTLDSPEPGQWIVQDPGWNGVIARLEIDRPDRGRFRPTAIRPSGEEASRPGLPRPLTRAANGAKRKPNVVLYVIDTLRADRLSVYGYPRATSPRLEDWLRRGVTVFEQAYSTGSRTATGIPSLLASIPAHDQHLKSAAADSRPTLAEVFQRNGYRTAGFQANFWLTKALGFARGFERYQVFRHKVADRPQPVPASAYTLQKHAIEWLEDNSSEPFFLYVQTMEPHKPYTPSPPFVGKFGGTYEPPAKPPHDVKDLGIDDHSDPSVAAAIQLIAKDLWTLDPNRYDECVADADHAFGQLLDKLDELDLLDDTVIVLTSDHGESLGEGSPPRYLHSFSLHEEQVHIPLLIRLPGQKRSGRSQRLVSLIDIGPTILESVGLDIPPTYRGKSLFAPTVGWPAVAGERRRKGNPGEDRHAAETFVRESHWKLREQGSDLVLTDLKKDPDETTNAASDYPITAAYLRTRRSQFLDRRGRPESSTLDLTAEEAEELDRALRALGYKP